MISATCHPERQHKALGMCGECWRRDYRKRYHATPHGHAMRVKHRKLYSARKYARNPQLVNRTKYLRENYGLSIQGYEAMYTAQGGCCAICLIKHPKLHIDHDHSTGRVRKLLCNGCNTGIAHFKEDTVRMAAAIAYVKSNWN